MSELSSPSGCAVVLLSGGMDSCVTLALAIEMGFEPAALHVNYGQRTQESELRAYTSICDNYSIPAGQRLVVDISHLAAIGGSALTDTTIAVPAGNLHSTDTPVTYVPFRNANILAIATSWAEVIRARAIFIGAVEEDSSGYPDCRQVFFDAFQATINTGTKPGNDITLHTPLIHLRKYQIVQEGVRLKAPLHLTWSCYSSETIACGLCDSCLLRLRGFAEAGVTDPIQYR